MKGLYFSSGFETVAHIIGLNFQVVYTEPERRIPKNGKRTIFIRGT